MSMKRILALVAVLCLVGTSLAAKKNHCCTHCGCQCCTVKVCHVVVETKMVPKTCYGCECTDVCVPGPSCLCGEHCECKKDPCTGCMAEKVVKEWKPGCAYVRPVAKLTKKEIQVPQKTYTWVVEELCPSCAHACGCGHGGCCDGGCCEPGCGQVSRTESAEDAAETDVADAPTSLPSIESEEELAQSLAQPAAFFR